MSFIDNLKDFSPQNTSGELKPLKVNNHLHTPHSFSAFQSVDEALNQSAEEGVKVVGVNDFFSFDAYAEWCEGAFKRNLFPLFNVEFIGLNEAYQKEGLKVNDPGNPGRTYFSGKSLAYPITLSAETQSKIQDLVSNANDYVRKMTEKVNDLLANKHFGFRLNYESIKSDLAMGQVRERHLARAIRQLAEKHYKDKNRLLAFYNELMDDKGMTCNLTDEACVENEIRNALLKAGKPAYVAEDPNGFLSVAEIRSIILEAGGIPTYPFLADAVKGYTDFERDLKKVSAELKKLGVWSVEFIPTRNNHTVLKEYSQFLLKEGFVVSFGTEHNSPGKQPIEVKAKGNALLDMDLMKINYEGACILAAHQYLFAKEGQGVLDADGIFISEKREEFAKLGHSLIEFVTNKN
ncbi:PHP domain-containing protein [Carboxylicivirga caseinilyticus]|uniref:PHP domain-containing protein n=1 Tax=Carboxylicivirga caseinilyticus TaxID=3417572 RepID=UPI003D34F0A0|nr:hypothetical protein [Marinilabiliaceae bacterium A049]